MAPVLVDGRIVLVVQWGRRDRLAVPGAVVLVEDPRLPSRLLLKRVVSSAGESIVLRGDNPACSTDSRQFGAVPLDQVRGRVAGRGGRG